MLNRSESSQLNLDANEQLLEDTMAAQPSMKNVMFFSFWVFAVVTRDFRKRGGCHNMIYKHT